MSRFRRRRSIRRRLVGAAMTAGVAWLFDPKQGSSRRAKLQDQLKGAASQFSERRNAAPSGGGGGVTAGGAVNGVNTFSSVAPATGGGPASSADRPPAEGGDVSFAEMTSGTDVSPERSMPDEDATGFGEPVMPRPETGDLP